MLALYTSIEEEIPAECVLCFKDTDEPILFGKKLSVGGVTAHHFCLVSESLNV